MSYVAKLNEAKQLWSAYLLSTGKTDEGGSDSLVGQIKSVLGGISEENLAELTAEDLTRIQVPIAIARKMVKAFGGTEKDGSIRQIVVVDDNPANIAMRLKPAELVGEYDPNEPDNAFGQRLKLISNNNPFLVFSENGQVKVPVSSRLLQELRDNFPPRKTVIDNGTPYQIYKVGERPLRHADENPVLLGTMLRPDGYSDANFRWGLIDFKVRQLVYIAIRDTKEIGKVDERSIFNDIEGKKFEDVAQMFPITFLKFKELEGGQSLPQMKVPLRMEAATK